MRIEQVDVRLIPMLAGTHRIPTAGNTLDFSDTTFLAQFSVIPHRSSRSFEHWEHEGMLSCARSSSFVASLPIIAFR